MHTDAAVNTVKHTGPDEFSRAAGRHLLGVLEDKLHFAAKPLPDAAQCERRAHQHGGMRIVSAHMSETGPLRAERRTGGFLHRKRIDIRAKRHSFPRAGSARERSHHTGRRRPFNDQSGERFERLLNIGGGFVLLPGGFGIAVNVVPPGDDLRLVNHSFTHDRLRQADAAR